MSITIGHVTSQIEVRGMRGKAAKWQYRTFKRNDKKSRIQKAVLLGEEHENLCDSKGMLIIVYWLNGR